MILFKSYLITDVKDSELTTSEMWVSRETIQWVVRGKTEGGKEYYTIYRSTDSLSRADVILDVDFFSDTKKEFKEDKDKYILLSKWEVPITPETEQYVEYLEKELLIKEKQNTPKRYSKWKRTL